MGLSVRHIDTAQVTALGSRHCACVSKAQKFPKFGRTVITKAILRLSYSHFSLSLSHVLTLESVIPCTISQNGDRWKEIEKSQRKLTVEVNSCLIRKRGPNPKEDVERESPPQAGEELISWNDGIELW